MINQSLDVIDRPGPRRRDGGVRTIRLAGVATGAIFLLVLAAAQWADYQTTLQSTRNDLAARASAFAQILDDGVGSLRAVYSAVSVQASDTTDVTDEELSAYLTDVVGSLRLIRGLGVVDPTLRVRGSGLDVSNFPAFRDRLSSDRSGLWIHPPERLPEEEEAVVIIPVTWRGPRSGQFIVAGGIPIATLSEVFAQLTDSEPSFSGVVLREDGLVLAVLPGADLPSITAVTDSAQALEQILGDAATFLDGPAIDGERRFSAFRSATSVGIIAGVSVTRADALAPFKSRLIGAGLLGLVGLLAIAVGTEYQARQSTSLSRAMAQFEASVEETKESENRFRSVVDSMQEGVVIVDADGEIWLVNPKAVEQFGYNGEELIGQPIEMLLPPRISAGHRDLRTKYMAEPSHRGMGVASDLWGRHKDGTEFPLEIILTPIHTPEGPMVMAAVSDITLRRRAEQEAQQLKSQLEQAAKMEAIGLLAGGVAHDFNNLLTVILGRTDLLADEVDSPELQSDLAQIRRAAEHAASLTHQLLAFSRKQVLTPEVLDLGDIVSGIEGIVRRLIPENIELTTTLATQVGRVRVDRNQIEQVFLNLAVNARDAMPGGGELTIDVVNAELTEDFVLENAGSNAGAHVLLTVRDTGTGMDAATLSRVFEPFFTTKEGTRGTGLGLATVYGIVKQSGGYVRVRSELGEGTTFEIYFPRTESEPGDAPEDGVVPSPARGRRTARVLLVEDDPTVRALLSDFLSHLGHKVLEAEDSADAIRIFEGLAEPVDVLLTDVVMPHMSGPELAKRLRALSPNLKVLFVSGYADESLPELLANLPEIPLLSKPFTLEELSLKLGEILASAGSDS